jgi:hypothetical protein
LDVSADDLDFDPFFGEEPHAHEHEDVLLDNPNDVLVDNPIDVVVDNPDDVLVGNPDDV